MAVEAASSNGDYQAAIQLAQKKKALEEEETALVKRRAEIQQQGIKDQTALLERNEKDLVKISNDAASKAEMLKKNHVDAVMRMNQQTQEHVETLATDTAKRITELDQHALKQIAGRQASVMERIKQNEDRTADPFYHIRSLEASWTENENGFEVKIKVPPHEQENMFVAAERNELKLSLARSFQDTVKTEDGRKNKTASHQTVTEVLTLPARVDPSTARREYKNGFLIYNVKKLV